MRKLALLAIALCLPVTFARAQNAGGFQLNRYEPTMPGAWFLAVEHPWYSSTRWFAGALTLDYNHNPLVFGTRMSDGSFTTSSSVVSNQLVGHVDLAGSFLDRINVNLTLPITFAESGNTMSDIGVGPISGAAVGDPRLSLMVRLWGQPDKDLISVNFGGHLWFPIGNSDKHAGDHNFRGLPKLVLAGMVANHLRWSASLGYLIRSGASIGRVPATGSTIGQELQLGIAAQYTDERRRWAVGPEFTLSTVTSTPGDIGKSTFFNQDFTSMELLGSGHYQIAKLLLASVGVGVGILRDPGTPDFRALLRLAYAPERAADRDRDGIADAEDACPDIAGDRNPDPRLNGCPADRDRDGVADAQDLCPDVPRGDHPDLKRPGCPVGDKDGDGVLDDTDQCPDVAAGAFPDPARAGCPLPDRDKDGIPDASDVCPDEPMGDKPDPSRVGCPLPVAPKVDTDKDGVSDDVDQCPTVPAGVSPDPARPGCPLSDRDGDGVPDVRDACPDQPGAPDPDPKKNGCPGLVLVKGGRIAILQPVLFIPFTDTIDPKSAPVLEAVGKALVATPEIKKVEIAGHTDFIGKPEDNLSLSNRRADAVRRYLIDHGTAPERLVAKGYGSQFPISRAKSFKVRQVNRRVEFVILDPAQPPAPTTTLDPTAAPVIEKAGKAGKRGGVKAPRGGKGPKGPKGGKRRRGH